MAYINNNGQVRVGVRNGSITSSTLLNSLYAVYKGDTTITSLNANLYAVYKGDLTVTSLNTNLFASYKGENNTNDSLGAYNGTAQGGLTYTTGKSGNAFTFNGTDAYIQLPSSTGFYSTGDFSISVWINPTAQGSYNTIYQNYGSGANKYGMSLYIQGSRVRFATYNVTGNLAYGNTSTILNNTWQHVVITKTAGNAWKMYINNTLQTLINVTGDITINPSVNVNNLANIGSDFDGVRGGFFNGKIDEVNIWNKELTVDEVTALYNSGSGTFYPNLSPVTITSANDSLNTYNGTPQGGLTYTTGKSGNAFTFNGTNAYVQLPNNSFNSLTSSFSVSFWLYFIVRNDQAYISNYDKVGVNQYGWFLYWNSGFWRFYIGKGTSTTAYFESNTQPSTSVWSHITLTYTPGQAPKLYVNGSNLTMTLQGGNVSDVPVYTSSQKCSIGNAWYGFYDSHVANGSKIDEVNIWNKELTSSEITALYNAGSGTFYPNLSPVTIGSSNDSLNTYNGTPQGGLTYTTGKSGNAFTFNGTNAYITLPSTALKFLGDFSVSLWVYIPTNNANNQTLIGCLRQPSIWTGWDIQLYANRIYFEFGTSSGKVGNAYINDSNIGAWKHVTATFKNGTGGKLYIDGTLQITLSTANPIVYDSTHTPTIGAMRYASGTTWLVGNGTKLDEVNLWNRELTQSEVTDLYNGGTGKFYPTF